MTEEESGTRGLSGKYIKHLKTLELISEGATNVIPLLTGHESEEAVAWSVAVTKLFKRGRIPQIFMFWEISPSTLETAISSNLKDTGKQLNGRFSVVSRNSASTKVLIYGSSLKADAPCEEPS
jgi:hypothetical protein